MPHARDHAAGAVHPQPHAAQVLHGLLVAGVAAAVLLVNLGGPALWDEDEPKNAACTLAMRATGDWVVPTYNGRLRVEKPVLVNWFQLVGCAIAGTNETGVRLASALLTIGTCLATWRIGRTLAGPEVGLAAGIAMACCVWTGIGGRAATPDAPLVFFTTVAFGVLARVAARGEPTPRFTRGDAVVFGAACGLAVLAKGPVGLALPLGCTVAFAVSCLRSTGDLARVWGAARIGTIGLVAIAVAGPWYAWVAWRTGGAWLHGFLFVHNVERFTSTLEGHSGTLLYYPVMLLVGLFPWSIAAGCVAWHAATVARSRARPREAVAVRVAAAWAVTWVGFFSLAGTKLPGYVWPAYPAIAIILGIYWNDWRLGCVGRLDRAMPVAWASLAASGLAIGIGLVIAARELAPGCEWCGLVGVVPIAGAIVAWRQDARGDRGRAIGAVAATGGLTVLLLVGVVTDRVSVGRSPRALVPLIARDSGAGRVASFRQVAPSVIFYVAEARDGESVPELWEPDEAAGHLALEPTARIVTQASFLTDLAPSLPEGVGVVDRFRALPSNTEFVLVGRLAGGDHGTAPPIEALSKPLDAPPLALADPEDFTP